MTWKNESQRHSMSQKGIKTAQMEADGLRFKGLRMPRNEVEKLIHSWKNEEAKQKALHFLNTSKRRPLVTTKDQIVWGLGGEIQDSYGNKWTNIAIYDRPNQPIEGTKSTTILPHMTKKDFDFLSKTRGVTHWNIRRNPFVASTSSFAPLVSTLGIKIKASSFQELDAYSDNVNKKLKAVLKVSRRQVR